MKTEVFKSYSDFLNREDKKVNGVSEQFAVDNPNYYDDNATNSGCWNCRYCSDCSYCSSCRYCRSCSSCSDCSYCSYCSYCSSCRYCRSCSSCSSCSDCSYCSYCSYCSSCRENNKSDSNKPEVPKIKNIHRKVFDAASIENSLDMSSWHSCETTHCRAGWVVHLAGKEGYALEDFYGTCLAAQLIYRESGYEINPCRFFDIAEEAMGDMKKLAEAEAQDA